MSIVTSLRTVAVAAFAASALVASPAFAASDYPERPVSWVIPFGAGGGTDRLARIFAAEADRIFGQSVTVENRVGAGGVLGWQYVLDQPADGYTIFNASPTPVITLLSEEEAPIEPTEIAIVGYIGAFASLLVANESVFADWDAFVAAAAERPLTVGGTNSTLLGVANMLSQAGVEVIYVSYSSTGEAVTDFLGGHIDAAAVTESTAATIVPENATVIVNTSSIPLPAEMEEALGGNVVMAADLGYQGIAFPRWVGVHPDTPEELQSRIADLVRDAAMDPVVQEAFAAAGEPVIHMGREEAREDYARLVEALRTTVKLLE